MIKAQARTLREDALRRVSRIGRELTRVHERERLMERAALGLIHDLSYKGAFVITEALQPASGSENKFDRTTDQITVPIKFDREVLGTIVIPMTAGRRITDAKREILDIFAEFLGIGLNNVRHIEQVRELAFIDSLTGIMNRRHLLEILPQELAKAKPIAIIAFDIDLFKAINDTYGHFAGDLVLRFVADRAKECLRKTDFLARYGGDEFVILLPHTRLQSARDIAERIRLNIERSPVKIQDLSVYCTVSVGIAPVARDGNPNSLMIRADQALYAAKHGGRNLVCSKQ